jgi:hypothetical protein
MTKKQAERKAAQIKIEAAEAVRRIRVQMEEESKPCDGPFCINRRAHTRGSGKCKFACVKPEQLPSNPSGGVL